MLLLFVLLLDVLELLSCVRQNDDGSCNLFAKFMKLLVSLLNLLVQRLVLNLELLKIN